MNAKQIEVEQATISNAQNLLISLKNEIMEIVKDPSVDNFIQPDTTAIEEEFDSLMSALVSAKNFIETVRRSLLEQKYLDQFEVIDGLNQHPSGLPFEEWLKVDELATHFGQPQVNRARSGDIDEAEAMFNEHQAMKEAHRRIYGE